MWPRFTFTYDVTTTLWPWHIGKQASKQHYLLMQARFEAAIQLMWACSTSACALRVTSEYSFTDLGRMDSWVGCWFVTCRVSNRIGTHAGIPHKIRNTAPYLLSHTRHRRKRVGGLQPLQWLEKFAKINISGQKIDLDSNKIFVNNWFFIGQLP